MGGKEACQFRAFEAQQMVDVAPGPGVIGIAMDAGGCEIGGACDHDAAIGHQKLVMHQATAAAAIGCVIDHGHPCLLQQQHRVKAAKGL